MIGAAQLALLLVLLVVSKAMSRNNRVWVFDAVTEYKKAGTKPDASQVKSSLIFAYLYDMIPAIFMGLILLRLDDKGFFGYCFLAYCGWKVFNESRGALKTLSIDADTMLDIVIKVGDK